MKRRPVLWAVVVGAASISAMLVAPPIASADQPYSSCKEAIRDGAAPLYDGDPGYSKDLDPNGDGVACLAGSGAITHYFPPKN